eukprot:m.164892 g.164892  ORF g.164892 m.164892 type:complete len:575 (+) comp17726_c0_seq1:361-2085(+)
MAAVEQQQQPPQPQPTPTQPQVQEPPSPQQHISNAHDAGTASVDGPRSALDELLPSKRAPRPHKAWKPVVSQPKHTIAYQVRADDTLTRVAVCFDMKPEEVCRLNRIKAVFPGQTLWVKDPAFQGPLRVAGATSKPASAGIKPLQLEDTGLAMGPVSPTDEVVRHVSRSAFFDDPHARPPSAPPVELSAEQTLEFVNETMARVRVRLVTNGQGVIPGILEVTCDYVRFTPDPVAVVKEMGKQRFTLYLDTADLLPPRSQENPPRFSRKMRHTLPEGGAFHDRHRTDSKLPAYIELRVRLIFGQKPKPSTIQPYWFAVPREMVDVVFSRVWAVCGVEELGEDEQRPAAVRNDKAKPISTNKRDQANARPHSWKPTLKPTDVCPEIAGESRLLDLDALIQLSPYLPATRRCDTLCLLYSTYDHGMSITSLYRSFKQYKGPCLMVITDVSGATFGAFTSHPWHISDTFYGSGETFLFRLQPDFKAFPWSRRNQFFMMGKTDSLMIGGGEYVCGVAVMSSSFAPRPRARPSCFFLFFLFFLFLTFLVPARFHDTHVVPRLRCCVFGAVFFFASSCWRL